MKGNIIKYGVVIALVIGSGGILMDISQQVQRAEREIKQHDRKIAAKEESIRVLKAEWAYLNDPARLELLVSKGLELSLPDSINVISDISPVNANKQEDLHRGISSGISRDISYIPNGGARQ